MVTLFVSVHCNLYMSMRARVGVCMPVHVHAQSTAQQEEEETL